MIGGDEMHPIIRKRMIHPAQWFKYIKRDGTGESVFAPPEDMKGFLWSTQTIVRNVKGEEVTSQRQFIVDFDKYDVQLTDELLLDGVRVPIIARGTYEPLISANKYQLGVLYL